MENLSRERHLSLLHHARKFYAMRSMQKTAEHIDGLINDIKNNEEKNYLNRFNIIEHSYTKDVKEKGAYEYQCYLTIKKIFYDAINEGNKPLLEDVFPISDGWWESSKNIYRLSPLLKAEMNYESRFLLSCFIYLIYCEGGFKSWIRILFYILMRTQGQAITIDYVNKKGLTDIKNMMIKRGVNPVLFKGYLNGQVRNGIAHGHLFFDESGKKLTIEHRDGSEVKWSKTYELGEFNDFAYQIAVIPDICFEIFELFVLKDICTLYSKKGSN